jgi:hypothetical protein
MRSALCGEIGLVDRLDAQSVGEAVGEVVGDVDMFGIDLGAVAVDQLDGAAGHEALGVAVVHHALRHELVSAIVDLHTANGRHRMLVVVIDKRIGGQQHLRAGRDRLGSHSLRQRGCQRHRTGEQTCQGGRPIEACQTGLPMAAQNRLPH